MTTDAPDSPIKPQVIDLQAEDITVEDETPPSPPPPPPAARNPRTAIALYAIAALAGALGGGWLYKDVLASYLPSNEMAATRDRVDALEAQTKTLTDQLAGMASGSDQLKGQFGSLETQVKSLADKTTVDANASAALGARIAAVEAATKSTKSELEELRSLMAAGSPDTAPGDNSGALALLAKRLDVLEKQPISKPSDQSAVSANLSQSLSDLKAKIAAGADFFQTQFVFDLDVFARYLGKLVEHGITAEAAYIVGVGPIASAKSARWMNDNLFGVHVPEPVIARLEAAGDQGAEGARIAAEIITGLRGMKGVAGAHIMAPRGEAAIAGVLDLLAIA